MFLYVKTLTMCTVPNIFYHIVSALLGKCLVTSSKVETETEADAAGGDDVPLSTTVTQLLLLSPTILKPPALYTIKSKYTPKM